MRCFRSTEGDDRPDGTLKWGNWRYDQKLIARAAHVYEGLGELPPRGPGRFHANESRHHLSEVLGYSIVERIKATNANLASPRAN